VDLNESAIKALVASVLAAADDVQRIGKNYYVKSTSYQIELTVNASNYRLITAGQIKLWQLLS